MIVEGIITTLDEFGRMHLAPMGPVVDERIKTLVLRPFVTSRTFRHLQERPEGVFHIVDDVLLLAQGAIGAVEPVPEFLPARKIHGAVLQDACRWFEFRIVRCDATGERALLETKIVHRGRRRDFFGFNRAKHAVVELAILATRLHLIPPDVIRAEIARLGVPVQKTSGPREQSAFELLVRHIERQMERGAS